MYECDAWNFPALLNRLRFQGNWLERQEFYNGALSRHRLIFGGSPRGLDTTRTPDDLYRVYGELKGAELRGEKSPFYCSQLRHLFQRHPCAAFILIWRDPRETYQSVVQAGRGSRFFKRPGMLNRLIFHQEQLIRQSAWLEQAGARLHQVSYDELVSHTEKSCREICTFLGIEFHPRMLRLADADLSAIPSSPQHDYLRRGVIARQQYAEQLVPPAALAKLERYRTRWTRLKGPWFGNGAHPAPGLEPHWTERVCDTVAGRVLDACDSCKRVSFEFLPLEWLRTYRQFKKWIFNRPPAGHADQLSLGRQFAEYRYTILAAGLYFGVLTYVHSQSNPHLMFLPLYLFPSAALTMIINRRWGIFCAVPGALIGPVLQWFRDTDYKSPEILVWNISMRLVFVLLIVMLLDRVRLELVATHHLRNSKTGGNI